MNTFFAQQLNNQQLNNSNMFESLKNILTRPTSQSAFSPMFLVSNDIPPQTPTPQAEPTRFSGPYSMFGAGRVVEAKPFTTNVRTTEYKVTQYPTAPIGSGNIHFLFGNK